MKKKLFTLLLVAVASVLLLSSCRLPASTAPQGSNTPEGELPFPVAPTSDLVNQILFMTQTALAGGGEVVAETPQPGQEATAQPGEAATAEPGTTGGQTGGGVPGGEQAGGGAATARPEATKAPARELPAAPERPSTYTIKKGEYPYCIARRYDINAGALLAANGLGPDSKVGVGFTLTIPSSGSWNNGSRSLRAHPDTYTVKSGDTIYSIACYYGDVYPEFIAAANGLNSPYTLTPGQELSIP